MSDPSAYVKLLLNAIGDQNIGLIKQILNTKNLIKPNEIDSISQILFNCVAKNGSSDIAILLINYGFQLSQDGNVLHTACEHGNVNIVHLLVNKFNLRLDTQDDREATPLHWAVQCQHYDTIVYILNNHLNQIDFNTVDKLNRTVHELALITRNACIISLMEEKMKYKMTLEQTAGRNDLFNKTQFNIKSFAKPVKTRPVDIPVRDEAAALPDLFDLDEELVSLRSPSLSPNSRLMKDTLSWLETQMMNDANTSLNYAAQNSNYFQNMSSCDILDQIKNGRELVLTEAGKQLLEFTDESESTNSLLKKLAKSFHEGENENRKLSKKTTREDDDIFEEEDDEDEDDENMTNMVKRGRFSASPKPQSNQFDIEIDSFINNFLNSR